MRMTPTTRSIEQSRSSVVSSRSCLAFARIRELSRLNRAKALPVDPDVASVVALAVRARDRTGGRFDPTVLRAVAAAGYDRSFEQVPRNGPASAAAVACGGKVQVDGTRIELAEDTELDLGGIGKGFAVERAACTLAAAGPCLVNAGGDLAVRGGPWPVGLETADGAITLELDSGAIATSGRDRRRWRRAGQEQHHLIDPMTGAPARSRPAPRDGRGRGRRGGGGVGEGALPRR